MDDRDDATRPEQPRSQGPAAGPHNPWALAAGGVALIVAGYFLMHARPPLSPRAAEQQRELDELRRMVDAQPGQEELSRRLAEIESAQSPTRALRIAGALAFWGGVLLFIAGGVRMYRYGHAPSDHEGLQEDCEN